MSYNLEDQIGRCIEVGLSEDFARVYHFVKLDLFDLRVHWRYYRSMFGANKDRFEFMFSISPDFARSLEQTMFETTLLKLRRLTDPKSSKGGKRSITIKALPQWLANEREKQLHQLVNDAVNASDFARNWSSKRVAHSDHDYRNGRNSLLPASRAKVEAAIEAIANVIKNVERNEFNTTQITHPIPNYPDEIDFLRCLYEGKMRIEEKKKLRKELSLAGDYVRRDQVFTYPEWLQRTKVPMDVD